MSVSAGSEMEKDTPPNTEFQTEPEAQPEVMPYASSANGPGYRRALRLCLLTWMMFFGALLTTIRACERMDLLALSSDGGDKYFQQNFPFEVVWWFAGGGLLCALVALVVYRKGHSLILTLLVIGLLANALIGGCFLREFIRYVNYRGS